jgi:DNA polymerase-3 subunit beta
LLEGVQSIQSALSTRTTLPILNNFLLEANGRVKIISTDMEMSVQQYMASAIETDGAITIPAKKFYDILQNLPDKEDIVLSVGETGKVSLVCGKSRFIITGTPRSEYPVLSKFGSATAFEVPASAIIDMVKRTLFTVSLDETRHVLNGALWAAKDGVFNMVTTDGRRLALASHAMATGKDFSAIVPTKILGEISRLVATAADKMLIDVTENQVFVQFKDTTMVSRLVSGAFPNYEPIIPAKKDILVTASTKELLAVTKRAALCADMKGGAVKYSLAPGVLHVTSTSQTLEFVDEIAIEGGVDEFKIGFNPAFVLDALKHVDSERVTIGMTTPVNPALIEPVGATGYKFIVMPMRA